MNFKEPSRFILTDGESQAEFCGYLNSEEDIEGSQCKSRRFIHVSGDLREIVNNLDWASPLSIVGIAGRLQFIGYDTIEIL